MILKKYNNSLKKFIYLTIIGPILGVIYIFINKLVLNYLYHSFLNNKKSNTIILRSFIDFYYSKQNKDKKKLIDNKLFFYSPAYQERSFLFYHNEFKESNLDIEEKNLLYFLKKFENFNFRNICQIGSSSGKNLEYFGKKFNFKNKIYTEIDDENIRLAKQIFKNKFHYFKCGAQNIDKILNDPLYENKKRDRDGGGEDLDLFFSCGSLQYCSPVFLEDFFDKISKAKTKSLLLISEPIELDFLLRENVFMSRKFKAFNYKYDFFTKKTKIKILKKEIYNTNAIRKDKYFRNISSYILISEIN